MIVSVNFVIVLVLLFIILWSLVSFSLLFGSRLLLVIVFPVVFR